ncbi:hypothetical protein Tco_0608806 [Tanacetum coccineum]
MGLLMIEGKTLKDREDPFRIITEDKKARIAKSFEQLPRMFRSRRSQDMSKYCHFHEDHGHDTNDCHQLRYQIEEVVKLGQLSHLVKGIKKERDESYMKNKFESLIFEGKEITFPSGGSNSSAPLVIKAKIFGREVNRVHMDSGSSCESVRKIPMEITIGDAPLTRKETLDFMIVKSDSPYNMLLWRTAMQKMGIVVSTIHGAIKFHATEEIGTVFSTYESDKVKEGVKKIRETPPSSEKWIFSCTTVEEKMVINNKYLEQTVTIGKQLPEHFKGRLRDLLRTNADVFARTHADMTGILRTITVKVNPFNTKQKLNEYSHVKPSSTAACKEVEELTKVGNLRKVKHQTWVANPVMVKKSDRGWRMYVDFTDINKAYLKDCYPLPEIDWKVESLSGF